MRSGMFFVLATLNFTFSCHQQKSENFNESAFGLILIHEIFVGNTDLPFVDTLKFGDEYNYLNVMVSQVRESGMLPLSPSMQWRVCLVKDNDVENIVSAPGGVLIVFTGLIQASKSPYELLFAIAHAMVHAADGHSFELLSGEFGPGLLDRVSAGKNTHVIPNLVNALITINYSKQQEERADSVGLEVVKKYSNTSKPFSDFYYSQDDEGLEEDFPNFISTHGNNRFRKKHGMERSDSVDYKISPQELSQFLIFKSKFR